MFARPALATLAVACTTALLTNALLTTASSAAAPLDDQNSPASPAAPSPNVLLIMTDDQGYGWAPR